MAGAELIRPRRGVTGATNGHTRNSFPAEHLVVVDEAREESSFRTVAAEVHHVSASRNVS